MELANVDRLIEKYLDGQTSIEEEQQLAKFFASNDVPEHLSMYKPLFAFFKSERQDVYSKNISLKPRLNYKRWISVSAVFLIFFFGILSYHSRFQTNKETQLAYLKTKEALNLLSQNFNLGAKQIAHLNEFEDTKNQIFKNH